MPKTNALSFARLVDWIEGILTEEEATAVAAQVAIADDATRADVGWLRAFAQVSATIVLAAPSPEVRDLLVRCFEAYAQGRRQPGFLQRLIATLTFDSGVQLAAAGARGIDAQGPQRQLIYATDLADIALNVQPRARDKHLDVNGQVLPKGDVAPDIVSVQLLRGTTELGITTTDELGEFDFEAIPAGAYEMVLSTDQFEIVIATVELQV
ncbi:MAG: hypothetical protein ACE5LU_18575 [Anaerolineae bacterium]